MRAPTPGSGWSGYRRLILRRSLHADSNAKYAGPRRDEQRGEIPVSTGQIRRRFRQFDPAEEFRLRRVRVDRLRRNPEVALLIGSEPVRNARDLVHNNTLSVP